MRSLKNRAAYVPLALFIMLGSISVGCSETQTNTARSDEMSALTQSIRIYEVILEDLANTYSLDGGGGISAIKQESTTSYVVHISQEGRKDLITYEISVGAQGDVEVVSRTESTKSY